MVVNELLYIAVTKHYRDLGLVRGRWDLRRVLAERGYPRELVSSIIGLLEELEVQILPEPQDYREMVEVAKDYRLLPSDAIIALTCRYHGVNRIITFDRDFERVPWLQVIS